MEGVASHGQKWDKQEGWPLFARIVVPIEYLRRRWIIAPSAQHAPGRQKGAQAPYMDAQLTNISRMEYNRAV